MYLWHGSEDSVILPLSVENSYHFLADFVDEVSIYLDNKVPANHGLSSVSRGAFCGTENTESFVERCNVSTVNRMLNHLFPGTTTLKDPPSHEGPIELQGSLESIIFFCSFYVFNLGFSAKNVLVLRHIALGKTNWGKMRLLLRYFRSILLSICVLIIIFNNE